MAFYRYVYKMTSSLMRMWGESPNNSLYPSVNQKVSAVQSAFTRGTSKICIQAEINTNAEDIIQ